MPNELNRHDCQIVHQRLASAEVPRIFNDSLHQRLSLQLVRLTQHQLQTVFAILDFIKVSGL